MDKSPEPRENEPEPASDAPPEVRARHRPAGFLRRAALRVRLPRSPRLVSNTASGRMADTTSTRVVGHTASRQSAAPPAVLGSRRDPRRRRGIHPERPHRDRARAFVARLHDVGNRPAHRRARDVPDRPRRGDRDALLPRTRPGAAGILIIFAAGWILLVGPCVAPAFVGYQAESSGLRFMAAAAPSSRDARPWRRTPRRPR